MSKAKFTKEEIEKIHLRLLKGAPKSLINKEYGVNPSYFSRAFKKYNLELPRGSSQTITYGDYFDVIDSEDKAYLLGIFFTDGYIMQPPKDYKHQNKLGLSVEAKDKALIDYTYSKIKPEKETKIYTSKQVKQDNTKCEYAAFTVYNNYIVNTLLEKYNFCFNKSTNLNLDLPLDKIPDQFIFSFIRGLIDGDGNITKANVKNKDYYKFVLGFCSSSLNVVNSLRYKLISLYSKNVNINISSRDRSLDKNGKKHHNLLHSICINNREFILWLALNMYKDYEFCLSRKRDRFIQLAEQTLNYSSKNTLESIRYANAVVSYKNKSL